MIFILRFQNPTVALNDLLKILIQSTQGAIPSHGQKCRTFEPAHFLTSGFLHKYISICTPIAIPIYPYKQVGILQKQSNMATNTSKRSRNVVDYKQLNALSSVVLYDTSIVKRKRTCGSFYQVERIITRRRICHVSCVFNSLLIF